METNSDGNILALGFSRLVRSERSLTEKSRQSAVLLSLRAIQIEALENNCCDNADNYNHYNQLDTSSNAQINNSK